MLVSLVGLKIGWQAEILRKPWPDDAIENNPVEVSAAEHIDALVGNNVYNASGTHHKGEVECPAT